MATENAFAMTPVDEIQIRELPPGRLLVAQTAGTYFEQSNRLFRRLFDYIKSNDIAMTVPVEGDMNSAVMRFHVGPAAPKRLDDTASVQVIDVPGRRVATLGARGGYGESNLRETLGRLERWLEDQGGWRASGEPYAVFWNGPFTPWFVKRYEVHIPVEVRAD